MMVRYTGFDKSTRYEVDKNGKMWKVTTDIFGVELWEELEKLKTKSK